MCVSNIPGAQRNQLLQAGTIPQRCDEAQFDQNTAQRLAAALKRRGVAETVLQEAMQEVAGSH